MDRLEISGRQVEFGGGQVEFSVTTVAFRVDRLEITGRHVEFRGNQVEVCVTCGLGTVRANVRMFLYYLFAFYTLSFFFFCSS